MSLDIRALRYFVATAQAASFTQAAQTLFVTQSTVSKMVRQLERDTGEQLLVREGRTARLTDAGRVVYAHAVDILQAMQSLQAEVREVGQLQSGELEVGIPPMINTVFTDVIRQFRERHEGIRLRLREAAGPEVERLVAVGDLEIGASVLPLDPDGPLVARGVGAHALWLVSRPVPAWAGRSTVPLSALRDVPLLLPTDDYALTRRVRQACEAAGFAPRIAAQSAHWDFLAAMAEANLGAAVLPEPLVRRLRTRGLTTVRLARAGLQWEVGSIWRRGRYLSHAARAWLAVCDEVLGMTRRRAAKVKP